MANMKRCLAQLTISGPWGTEHFWAGLEPIDLDRVLVPVRDAVPAKGAAGTDGYVPARLAVKAFTVADAIAGREDCFEDIDASESAAGGPAPVGFTHTDVPLDTDFTKATLRRNPRATGPKADDDTAAAKPPKGE